jgi:hypothetical protein
VLKTSSDDAVNVMGNTGMEGGKGREGRKEGKKRGNEKEGGKEGRREG